MKKYYIIITLLVLLSYATQDSQCESATVVMKCTIVDCSNEAIWGKVAKELSQIYEKEGYHVSIVELTDFLRYEDEIIDKNDVFVFVSGDALPPITSNKFLRLLEKSKTIVVCSAPIWRDSRLWDGESLLSVEDFTNKHKSELLPSRDFIMEVSPNGWHRESNNIDSPAEVRYLNDCGLLNSEPLPALQVSIADMKGWDVFVSPALENPFDNGKDLTVFFAKGGESTRYLTLEWREKDSSRWLTSVPLSKFWNYYVLTSDKFSFWDGPPERRGTQFVPENAVQFCFGLAMSHSPISTGKHNFSIAGLGTQKKSSVHDVIIENNATPPKIELLYPDYKFYISNDVEDISVFGEILPGINRMKLPVPKEFHLFHPRPSAGGYNKKREWRWASIAECYGKDYDYRGTISALMLYTGGKFKGSVVVSFGVQQPEWYLDKTTLQLMKALAHRLRSGVYFLDTGSEFYTYFPEQNIKVGANVLNLSSTSREKIKVDMSLVDKESGKVLCEKALTKENLNPFELWNIEQTMDVVGLPKEMVLESRLLCDGELLEEVLQEVNIWIPKEEKEYIVVKNGDFVYKGKRWCPYGVNYMPSSGIGTEDNAYFEFWLGARSYDPRVIQRDLDRIVKMGMNSISVFLYHQSMSDQNLLDLLYRADKLGLKVNLSLRPGTPFDFEWEKIKQMIEFYRLPEHDEVFAYDLAWEPMFPGHEGRKRWDDEWGKWIINRYGSLENAELDWKYPVPRDATGKITNPKDEQLMKEGEWRKMVCAYRRFLDTLLYKYYNRARRLVRSVDPFHSVSFRMTEASNPTNGSANPLPYDWYYLACAVDILEPEGYGRIGSWEVIKPGIFQVQYGRLCNPKIPLIWAEMGMNVFRSDGSQFEKALQAQAQFYNDFLKMVLESDSDGIYFWWYPGGYRVNEKSDFGIINPDGTFRPVSSVILENSNLFNRQELKVPDYWIEIDRDETSRGIAGVYENVKDKFWQARDNGKFPGLKTAGTNATSANCPLTALGNTEYNGNNPLKYLDSFFYVILKKNTGEFIELDQYDSVVELSRDELQNSSLSIEVVNLGEAKWLDSSGEKNKIGCVYLVITGLVDDTQAIQSDVEKGESTSFTISLPEKYGEINFYMESYGRARFGEKRSISVIEKK